jgi:16S rRNA (cytidine1402-2'-O)-methyltransferase
MTGGVFYIVPTPIGNLEDISSRALKILRQVDFIAAEDTRHSQHLLQHYGISTPCISVHEHNERKMTASIVEKLKAGQQGALISDAGTPVISDPGDKLIQQLHEEKIRVVPLPGPSALITALSASGFAGDRFLFEGFLPAKTQQRQEILKTLVKETRTLLFYEAPHRIVDMIQDATAIFGESRQAMIARELTKTFESLYRGSLKVLQQNLNKDSHHVRGEFVVVIEGYSVKTEIIDPQCEKWLVALQAYLPTKQVAKVVSEVMGVNKNQLYEWMVKNR